MSPAESLLSCPASRRRGEQGVHVPPAVGDQEDQDGVAGDPVDHLDKDQIPSFYGPVPVAAPADPFSTRRG